MAQSRREKLRQDMQRQVLEAQKAKNYSTSSFVNYFSVPDDVNQWSPKKSREGSPHQFDIVPFQIGPKFPDAVWKTQPVEGDFYDVMDLHVHRNIGPNNTVVICPKHTYKSGIAKGDKAGCPICELLVERQAELQNDPEERKEVWKQLKPSRRTMFNVIVRDNGEEEAKGVQIWEVAHFYMQKELASLSEDTGDGVITYSDPDMGKKIYFKIVDKGQDVAPAFEAHQFKDRTNPKTRKPYVITDQQLDQTYCLEEFLNLMSYDEIKELLNQDNSEPEEQPEEQVQTGSRMRGQRTQAVVEDMPEPVSTSDDNLPWDGESCPYGYELGLDCVTKPECEDCAEEVYTICANKKEELEKAEREKKRTERRRLRP